MCTYTHVEPKPSPGCGSSAAVHQAFTGLQLTDEVGQCGQRAPASFTWFVSPALGLQAHRHVQVCVFSCFYVMCVMSAYTPWHSCRSQKTTFGIQFYPTAGSEDGTQVVKLMQFVLLPTEPSCENIWPFCLECWELNPDLHACIAHTCQMCSFSSLYFFCFIFARFFLCFSL